MSKLCGWILASAILVAASGAQGQGFGGMLDRLGDRMQKKTEERVQQNADKAVDSVFDTTEGTVKSAGEGAGAAAKPEPTVEKVAKCQATDKTCLSKAKASGQKVEILSDEDVDVLRCSPQDRECLQRAQQLGKKVELID